jgi:zinc protease
MVKKFYWRPPLALLPAALALALLAAGPVAAQQMQSPYKTMKLDNGLEVVVIENHSVPLVTVDIAVRNGSFTEPDEFAGLSHLYEHMFYKANAAIPSQELFMDRVRELGITFNGYTSDEVVTYFFTLPSGKMNEGMRFMADAIRTPTFKDDELVKEREVVLSEFDRNEAQPSFVLNRAIDSALWMPYVSRKQPLGQRPVIKTATVEKMKMIQNRFYVPNNSALIVSGDVKADDVFALAKKYYADWKQGANPFPTYNAPAFPPLTSKLVVREAKVPEVMIHVEFFGPSIGKDDQDVYSASLLTELIGQSTSRFSHNLVDSGLVTQIFGGYNPAHNGGTIGFFLTAPKEKAKQALSVLKSEIAAMGRPGYFSDTEIATAKNIAADEKLFDQDNVYSFTIRTSARWWSMASLDYYLHFSDNLATVSSDQLRQVANKYLVGKPYVLGVGAQRATLDELNFTQEALRW